MLLPFAVSMSLNLQALVLKDQCKPELLFLISRVKSCVVKELSLDRKGKKVFRQLLLLYHSLE